MQKVTKGLLRALKKAIKNKEWSRVSTLAGELEELDKMYASEDKADMLGNKKLWLFGFASIVIGFLLVFFYQVLIEPDVFKFKESYRFNFTQKTDKFYMLTGWRPKKEMAEFASMRSKRAILLFSIPIKDTVALKITYRLHNPKQIIKVYKQKKLIGLLKTTKVNKWAEDILILTHGLAEEGLNKLEFIKTVSSSEPDFKKITVANYNDKNLTFLRAYPVWESTRWFRKRGDVPINWRLCFLGGVGFLGLWLLYASLFWSITNERYSFILKKDFWTYLPTVIIFSILFIIGRIISNYTFFYYRLDYWLILVGSMSVGKIYQIIKYAKMDKFKLRMRQLKNITIGRYNLYANILIIMFIILFFSCAILLIFSMKVKAEWLANWAFLFLIMGIVLKLIKYFAEEEYLEDK
jgi:hypothetical protein